MMNMVGLFASLYNDGGGIAPSLPYCNPLTDPYGCLLITVVAVILIR
jgi:hypothetical protein